MDGKLLRVGVPKVYLLLYKPRGVLSTLHDPKGRPTIADLLRGVKTRVYPVGRLDMDSEGLLVLTNDGELAYRLMHPRYEVRKTYRVKVKGVLTEDERRRLEQGVVLPPLKPGERARRTAPATVRRVRRSERNSWIEITLHEGRQRQVRRMLERVGHPVIRLKRIRYGILGTEGLAPGTYRPLTPEEVRRLWELVSEEKPSKR